MQSFFLDALFIFCQHIQWCIYVYNYISQVRPVHVPTQTVHNPAHSGMFHKQKIEAMFMDTIGKKPTISIRPINYF